MSAGLSTAGDGTQGEGLVHRAGVQDERPVPFQQEAGDDHPVELGDERFPEAVGVEQPSFLGTNTDQTTPVQVGAATTWVSVSADSNHTCAIETNGRLLCWGSDTHGQVA